ncbi:MAG TPA: hypothetical protein VN827_03715 [Chthoniobacterales bacterium]|nr:hypothetical protein [Chthoniobacterales bacterium]
MLNCLIKEERFSGPQRNRQRFADTPTAPIDAAIATENPALKTNGSVMETKPLLMPYGRTRKKKVTGLVDSRISTRNTEAMTDQLIKADYFCFSCKTGIID